MLKSDILKKELQEQLEEEKVFLLYSKIHPVGSRIIFEDIDVNEISSFDGIIMGYDFDKLRILVTEPNSHNQHTHFITLSSIRQ